MPAEESPLFGDKALWSDSRLGYCVGYPISESQRCTEGGHADQCHQGAGAPPEIGLHTAPSSQRLPPSLLFKSLMIDIDADLDRRSPGLLVKNESAGPVPATGDAARRSTPAAAETPCVSQEIHFPADSAARHCRGRGAAVTGSGHVRSTSPARQACGSRASMCLFPDGATTDKVRCGFEKRSHDTIFLPRRLPPGRSLAGRRSSCAARGRVAPISPTNEERASDPGANSLGGLTCVCMYACVRVYV